MNKSSYVSGLRNDRKHCALCYMTAGLNSQIFQLEVLVWLANLLQMFTIYGATSFGDLGICDLLINRKNLRTCDLRTSTPKELRIFNCNMSVRFAA
jgi:hypothetical protein